MIDFENFHKNSECCTVNNISVFDSNLYLFSMKVLWVYTSGNTLRIIWSVEQH